MIKWEAVKTNKSDVDFWRAKVPGGWLIMAGFNDIAVTFYPDPQHLWDGSSLP